MCYLAESEAGPGRVPVSGLCNRGYRMSCITLLALRVLNDGGA